MRIARMIAAAGLLVVMAPASLAAQELNGVLQNYLRAYIVDGRITFEGTRLPNIGPIFDGTRREVGQETLQVRNENGQCAFLYERRGKEDQLTIDVRISTDRLVRQVLLRRTSRAASAGGLVEFKQPANEKLTLTLGSGTGQRVFSARNLWQLLIAEPKQCRQHLLPLRSVDLILDRATRIGGSCFGADCL